MQKNTEKKLRKNRKRKLDSNFAMDAAMFFFTILISTVAAYFYGMSAEKIVGISILAGAGFGGVLFTITLTGRGHTGGFMFFYLFSLAACALFPLLPFSGWPYLVIFIGLMLFSEPLAGLGAGCVLLIISSMLGKDTGNWFFIYLITGLVGILFFSPMDKDFKAWPAVVISLLTELVGVSVGTVLFSEESFQIRMLAVPAVNLSASFILLAVLLKAFRVFVLGRNNNIYMDINDPESLLLVELKKFSDQEYYHAVHTAYLCDRIAKALHLDSALVKACGYYHRIGLIRGENSWENIESILGEQHFPGEVLAILKEYTEKKTGVVSREAVVLLFCDAMVSSLSYLFSREPDTELDYSKLIQTIFKRKAESGAIDGSCISMAELQEMRRVFVEEKPYYDFLR